MVYFQYDTAILAAYPDIVGGVIIAEHVQNPPASTALHDHYRVEQQSVIAQIGENALSDLPQLAAWRAAFRKFGIDPTQYRSAAEALLRRLTKKGDIPSINTLVDVGNLVSIRYRLPVAMFDQRAAVGGMTVHFADGSEVFTPLGESAPEHPEIGEVIFSNPQKEVAARRWCWRQSAQSAAREDTTALIVTVEAHHANALPDIQAAVNDLISLIAQFAGGICRSAILTAHNGAV
ncbi:MAG: phenylalanine--tRNA ligase beta subunit-related protein [Anaerolineae bacterium]